MHWPSLSDYYQTTYFSGDTEGLLLKVQWYFQIHLVVLALIIFALGIFIAYRVARRRYNSRLRSPIYEEAESLRRKLQDLEGTRPQIFAAINRVLGPAHPVTSGAGAIEAVGEFEEYCKKLTSHMKAADRAYANQPANMLATVDGRQALKAIVEKQASSSQDKTFNAAQFTGQITQLNAEIKTQTTRVEAINAEKIALLAENSRLNKVIAELRAHITALESQAPTLPARELQKINALADRARDPSAPKTIDG